MSAKPVIFSTLMTLILPLAVRAEAGKDPKYFGSSFNEVVQVITDQSPAILSDSDERAIANKEMSVYQSHVLPHYPVNFFSMMFWPLVQRSKQTLIDEADYYPRLVKWVHANGVCVTGKWKITEASPYTGVFKKDTDALFIGRISVALQDTTNAGWRGFGFAGKIYPTNNPAAVVKTSNFLTVDVLSGTPAKRFFDVGLTNSPRLIPRVEIAGELAKIATAFPMADTGPTFRPITQLSKVGENGATHSARFMRLSPASDTVKNNLPDFRNEVLQAMTDNRELVFNIDVSDTTADQNAKTGWTHLGTVTIDHAMVSYGCDRRLHFGHSHNDGSGEIPKPATKTSGGKT